MKKNYLVIACSRCQQFLVAREGIKTRQCPYCGTRMTLSKIEVLSTTSDIEEARSILHSKRESMSEQLTATERRKRSSTRF